MLCLAVRNFFELFTSSGMAERSAMSLACSPISLNASVNINSIVRFATARSSGLREGHALTNAAVVGPTCGPRSLQESVIMNVYQER